MDLMQTIQERHSVRAYTERAIDADTKAELTRAIDEVNRESGLHIQLVTDEPQAFQGMMARYGGFSGVRNYIALIGKKSAQLEEQCGYWGEHLVLLAQQLGLNTCWVGLTYKKLPSALSIQKGEKLALVIAVGYGQTQGKGHKIKEASEVASLGATDSAMPDWFANGVDAALLAPTAVNQQKFHFTLTDKGVVAEKGRGFYSACDLGIVKYHFEIGAQPHQVTWL